MGSPYDKSDWDPLSVFAYEQITVANVAVGFTAGTYNPTNGPSAKAAFCQLETAQIRHREDGTNPTSTVGTPKDPGEEFIVWGSADLAAIKFIRTGATSATLNVAYVR